MASLIGKEIGKYRITERLGQGGMAEVYLGIHTHLDRKVAIKVLHSHLLEGGDFIARLMVGQAIISRIQDDMASWVQIFYTPYQKSKRINNSFTFQRNLRNN